MTGPKSTWANHFHTSLFAQGGTLEASIIGTVGPERDATSFSTVFIRGSHRAYEFYQTVQRQHGQPNSVKNKAHRHDWFGVVRAEALLHTDVGRAWLNKAIPSTLWRPAHVDAVCVDVSTACLVISHANMLRCNVVPRRFGRNHNANLARVAVQYRACVDHVVGSSLRSTPRHAQQQYEQQVMQARANTTNTTTPHSAVPPVVVWPLQSCVTTLSPSLPLACVLGVIRTRLTEDGVVVLQLSEERMQTTYLPQLLTYLHTLVYPTVEIPKPLPLMRFKVFSVYRNPRDKKSTHFPKGHGQTGYGRCCQAAKSMYLDVALLLDNLFACQDEPTTAAAATMATGVTCAIAVIL